MRGFLIGMVLGSVLIAAAVVVPHFLRSSDAVDAVTAREQAELARRQLAGWNPVVETLVARADLENLKQADAAALLAGEEAQANLNRLNESFSATVSAARSTDSRANLETTLQAVDTSAGGLARAIQGFESFATQNADMWTQAQKNARAAASAGRNVFGVPVIAGMTDLARARQLYGQATGARTEMRALQTAALAAADQLAAARAELSRFRAISPDEAIDGLRSDRETMRTEQQGVEAEANRLKSTIGERETEIEQILAQIASARSELLNLQNQGFQAGNDSAFANYRSQYTAISNRMRDLQEREHMLRWGGFEQGELDWTALLTQDAEAVVEFDGPVLGLEELQRRLALLEDKQNRYGSGIKSLGEQAAMAEAIGESATKRVSSYEQAVARNQEALAKTLEMLKEVSARAIELEDAALESAGSALNYFGNSRTAAEAIKRSARQTQTDFDPQRLNERLKKELADGRPSEMAATAEAEAQTLIGRIYADRVRGIEDYQTTLGNVSTLSGTAVAVEDLAELLTQAREEGSSRLSEAIEAYNGMAEAGGNTAWIFHAAKGTAEYLRGIINPSEAATYRANAITAMQAAVDQAGNSPYGRKYVLFLETLQQ